MKLKRLSALGSALILGISALLSIGFAGTAFAAGPYTCTWTGASSNNMNVAGNWSGCNSSYPQAGDNDNLVFNSASGTNVSPDNNIGTLNVGSITFTGDGAVQYTFTGSTIDLLGGMTIAGSNYPTFDNNITLEASQSLSGDGGFTLGDGSHTPTLNVGTYTLTLGTGSDTFFFSNADGSIAGSGSLVVNNGDSADLISPSSGWTGSITEVGNGYLSTVPGGTGSASSITVPSGGELYLNAFNGGDFVSNLTVGGTDAIYSEPDCSHGCGNPAYTATASVDFTGTVTLTANTTIQTEGTVTISGPLSGNYTVGLDAGEVGQLVVASSNNTSRSANGTQSSALQVTTVAAGDNQPSLQVFIADNEEYIINGVRGQTEVGAGGILKGTGTVGALTVDTANGSTPAGIVSPGDAPGCITVNGTLDEAGTYQAQIGGTTACSGYNQLDVTGTVTLNDGGTPPNSGTLQVSLINGFKPSAGQTFEIINNESSSPVSGTFSGLTEGSEITVSGYVFKISYVGGTGNDVVLTVVSVPAAPNTGLGLTSTRIGLPLLGTAMIAGFLVLASRINSRKVSKTVKQHR